MENQVAEATYFKELAKSCKLHEMIVELRKLEMEYGLIVHFLCILLKQMIKQGTDGLSLGEFASRIMQRNLFFNHLPLNETILFLKPSLRKTVLSFVPKSTSWRFTTTEMWFDNVYKDLVSQWIWTPPPCLAKITVDELCKAKHIMPGTSHLFVCPIVMTQYWRKTLGKIEDLVFTLKAGTCIWNMLMLEPLTVAFAA